MPSMNLAPKGPPVSEETAGLFQHKNRCRTCVCVFAVSSDSLKDSKGAQESDPAHPMGCKQDQAEGKVFSQHSLRHR